jgi:hypothetical protein
VTDKNSHEPAGSVAEEAAKLLQALQGWAKESGSDYAGATGAAAQKLASINEHIATGAADCKYCPVCQALALLRRTSPEVKAHLADAASSLLQAAAGAMATHVPEQSAERSSEQGVEKIDLSDDLDWEDD